jgi:hypothetical protein
MVTGESGGESLSWDDFCGYKEIKKNLKRLLSISKKENKKIDNPSSSDSLLIDQTSLNPNPSPSPNPNPKSPMTLRESLQLSNDKVKVSV